MSLDDCGPILRTWHVECLLCGHRYPSEDGVTIVVTVVFEDEAGYRALSDDPEQAQWWETQMRPLLDADPQWIDGHWALSIDRTA